VEEPRDEHGVDAVGLRAAQVRVAERARLQRVEHADRGRAPLPEPRVQREPVDAGRLQADLHVGGRDVREPGGQLREAGAGGREAQLPDDRAVGVEQRGLVPLLADVEAQVHHR
jgi:hypothetical protein